MALLCHLQGASWRMAMISNAKTGAPRVKQLDAVLDAGAARQVQRCDTLANVFEIQVWLITIGGPMIRLRGIVVHSP